MFKSLCLLVENLRICNLRIGSPTKFADLHFADQSKEICGLAYLRNLWIFDCRLRPRICGFKKNSCFAIFANLLRGLGETDSWKKPEVENLVAQSLKLSFACTKLYKVKTADSRCYSLPTGNYVYPMNLHT